MGRRPCCAREGLKRGSWSAWEDKILVNYIEVHGEGKWRELPEKAGLKRCGKSCRLRWLNYLRPDIKRGNISMEEEDLIIRLHKLLGNRWALIAGRLPGRTDNEIKNYWNTNLSKRLHSSKVQDSFNEEGECLMRKTSHAGEPLPEPHPVIRTRAMRCSKIMFPAFPAKTPSPKTAAPTSEPSDAALLQQGKDAANIFQDFDFGEILPSDTLKSFLGLDVNNNGVSKNFLPCSDLLVPDIQKEEEASGRLQPNEALELKTLIAFLDSDDDQWITKDYQQVP